MGLLGKFISKSRSAVLHITSDNGFHLRPAARFSSEAKKFTSTIEAETRGKSVDAKDLNALLTLGLEKGDHFELTCKGKDADEAIETLLHTFETLMENDIQNQPSKLKKESVHYTTPTFNGTPVAAGIAICQLWHYHTVSQQETRYSFDDAVSIVRTSFLKRGAMDPSIMYAQEKLFDRLTYGIHSLEEFAKAINKACLSLQEGGMASKCDDYQDLLWRVKQAMGYQEIAQYPNTPFILVAEGLLPSDVETLPPACKGVVLYQSSPMSHTSILLRTANIPTIILAHRVPETDNNSVAILDASAGNLVLNPSEEDINLAQKRLKMLQAHDHVASKKRLEPASTKSGKPIKVFANITGTSSAKEAKEGGAEGIGLLRTEFLFQENMPSFEEQQDAYHEIFSLFDEITIRTLDVGGDKALPYIDLPMELNPFLGIRGVRLFQSHPEIIATQLHAIFSAAKGKSLKVMFPMVATPEEFMEAKTFAQTVATRYNCNIDTIQFGIMVEIPSVLFRLSEFNTLVDFYSIGTNDLNQYLHAIDRTHHTLTLDPHAKALFTAIKFILSHTTKPVTLCGELAADEKATAKLIAMGLETFSVSPKHIPKIKERIRHV